MVWSTSICQRYTRVELECPRKKAVGEPYEGKPHVRIEVAGDGNQDKVEASEALLKETWRNRYALPKSQAPFLDPTLCEKSTKNLMVGEKHRKGRKFKIHSQIITRNSINSVAQYHLLEKICAFHTDSR